MRAIRRILWTVVLVAALFVGYQNRATLQPQVASVWNRARTEVAALMSGNLVQQLTKEEKDVATPSSAANATPMESIVQGVHLSKTYYYHYAGNLPTAAQRVFANAVATYNRTGIVHLIEGQAPSGKNSITFTIYHKQMAQSSAEIELGHGGPSITNWTTLAGTTSQNQAIASLNADYTKAFSDAVATHELGHALGLAHSSSIWSVMYPISQGRSKLSAGDIAGLKAIYDGKS